MDIIETALVHQRVAELHRDAQASRLAAAARAGHARPSARPRAVAHETAGRVAAWLRSLRPAALGPQDCCA